jgi:hypothetical protein
MEFPPSPPPAARRPIWRRPAAVVAVAALLAYATLLAHYVNAVAGGSDSSGYLNHARILATGRVHIPAREIPGLPADKFSNFLYSPLGLKPAPNGDGLVPTYPTGLPLMILAARPFGGWAHACDLVMVIHALGGILLTFALGRAMGVSARWSALGAALLAACPLYLNFSLQAMSDVPALVWAAAAALAAWRARERPLWALAAGGALAVAVLVRPNNVLLAAPLAIAWWPERFAAAEVRGLFRRIVLLGLAAIPGAVFFCLHSRAAYGSVLTTGYGDTTTLFEPQVIAETLRHYIRWLPALLSPLVCLVLLLPWAGRRAARPAAFLGSWAGAYLAFYACYYHTHEAWWYLRFLLPAVPALIVGAMKMGERLGAADSVLGLRPAQAGPAAFLVLAVLAVTEETYWDGKFNVLLAGRGEAAYPLAAQWLKTHVPPDAILAVMQTSGAVFYYTDFSFVRWDQFDAARFPLLTAAAAAAHRPIYAPLYDFETADVMQRMPGAWKIVGRIPKVTIWQWAGVAAPPP